MAEEEKEEKFGTIGEMVEYVEKDLTTSDDDKSSSKTSNHLTTTTTTTIELVKSSIHHLTDDFPVHSQKDIKSLIKIIGLLDDLRPFAISNKILALIVQFALENDCFYLSAISKISGERKSSIEFQIEQGIRKGILKEADRKDVNQTTYRHFYQAIKKHLTVGEYHLKILKLYTLTDFAAKLYKEFPLDPELLEKYREKLETWKFLIRKSAEDVQKEEAWNKINEVIKEMLKEKRSITIKDIKEKFKLSDIDLAKEFARRFVKKNGRYEFFGNFVIREL